MIARSWIASIRPLTIGLLLGVPVALGFTLSVGGCSGEQTAKEAPANPVRDRLEAAIAALPSDEPLQLRYNPAACDCPAFEVRLANSWVRAVWTNVNLPQFQPLRDRLLNSGPDKWPQAILAKATVDAEPVRTVQGIYAVRVDVKSIETSAGDRPKPLAKEPPTAPKAPADGKAQGKPQADR